MYMYMYMYMYIYIYIHMRISLYASLSVYTYIYIYRERERYTHIHIYIYTHTSVYLSIYLGLSSHSRTEWPSTAGRRTSTDWTRTLSKHANVFYRCAVHPTSEFNRLNFLSSKTTNYRARALSQGF